MSRRAQQRTQTAIFALDLTIFLMRQFAADTHRYLLLSRWSRFKLSFVANLLSNDNPALSLKKLRRTPQMSRRAR